MSTLRLTTLGIAILLLTFAGSIAPSVVTAQQTSACATGGAVPDPDDNPGLVSDCETLLAARDTLAGTATLNWATDTPMSQWDGVLVEATRLRVTVLFLNRKGLTGEIPTELGDLSNLEALSLSNNQLTGEVPMGLGNLSSLKRLSLYSNQLMGVLPEGLTGLSVLERFDFYNNPKLCAPIDEAFQAWLQGIASVIGSSCAPTDSAEDRAVLVELYNATDGANWTNNTNWLSERPIREWLGVTIDASGRVNGLVLVGNGLAGEVPTELESLSSLTTLRLGGNQLTGEIPTELGNLANLRQLVLYSNQLTGEIPRELGNLSNLRQLVLYSNQLTGEIPRELGNLSNLRQLDLFLNQLTGEIPTELGNLSNLEGLFLSRNQLTGEVPSELGHLSNMTQLYLNSNQLTGELPQSLTGLTVLRILLFYTNDGLCAPTDEAFQTWLRSLHSVRGDNCAPEDSAEDRAVLVELYNSTGGANWADNTNWLSDEPMREWHGVTTDDEGRVSVLTLDENQLSGEIPTELGNLSNLQRLHLGGNQLTGGIPTELGSLTNMQDLYLGENQLTGGIPAELESLPNLQSLNVGGNQLTGEIPEELGSLSDLQWLSLYDNQLTGEIPMELGSLSELRGLWLYENQLTGEIPQSLTGLTMLETLEFHDNAGLCAPTDEAFQTWLQGVATVSGDNCAPPDSAEDRAVLVELYNSTGGANWTDNTNWLSEEPMREWHGVTTDDEGQVAELSLSDNQLSGEIPTELGSLANLQTLWLFNNQLTGKIPAELGNLSNLTGLSLSRNQLTEEIPTELGNLSNLRTLILSSNQLTGEIPTELGNLSNLRTLILSSNQLTGEIPTELGNLSNLRTLILSSNQLTGEIPTELGNLSNLQRLNLHDNQLTGELPQSLTGLTVLSMLSFNNNAGLCAPIDEAFQIWLLSVTSVSGSSCAPMDSAEDRAVLVELYNATDGANWTNNTNWLSDRPIREWHGVVNDADGRVSELRLVTNELTGEIPTELGSLSNLQRLILSSNQLTGEIPMELGDLSNLQRLILSSNQLTGEIPMELGDLSNLQWLILSSNQLTGEIPAELGNLTGLTILRLSSNQLTGEIPAELGNLTGLTFLRLANNQFTGCMQDELRHFSTIPANDLDMLGLAFCADLPEAPTIDEVTAGTGSTADSLLVKWSAPASEGASALTAYDVRYIETAADETDDSNWTVVEDVWTTGGGDLQYTIAGFSMSTQYDLQVRAVNDAGDGPWSETVTGTPTVGACVSGGAVADATNMGLIADCQALLAGRDTLAGTATLNWATDMSITQWEGVGLGGTPRRVTRLNLSNAGLNGTIPSVLGRLSMLTSLNLRSNDGLTGEIPNALGNLGNLRVLNLHSNSHTGAVPDLRSATRLEELYLPNNADYNADGSKVQGSGLTGQIPTWLNDMTNMRELWLWGNDLNGSIPDLSGMTSLRKLKLANNMLTGGVPAASQLPPNMTWLIIDRNPLGGTIPDLSSLTRLKLLWLHSNELTGSIPAGNNFSASLDDLNLRDNTLTGTIPDLSNLDNLTRLRLHNNSLSGEIPASLGSLDSLRFMWLYGNMLSGRIPTELGSLGQLERLWLSENELEGQIPHELGYLRNLVQWRLAHNQFTGCLPIGLGGVDDTDLADLGLQVCGILEIEPPLTVEPVIASLRTVIRPHVAYAGNDRLSYSLVEGPDEMAIDFNTGTITWTPNVSDEGQTMDVSVRVTDGARFAQTSFQMTVIEPEEIETEVTESQTDGNKLIVTDTDTNLNGLETTSPPDAPPITLQTLQELQELFEKAPADSVPEIPSYITPISDVFLVKGQFANPVEFRFPVDQLPDGVPLYDVNLYAYVDSFDRSGKFWTPVLEDQSIVGTESQPVFVVELAAMTGMAFFGYHHTNPPTPFDSEGPNDSGIGTSTYQHSSLGTRDSTNWFSPPLFVDRTQITCSSTGYVFDVFFPHYVCTYGPDPEVKIRIKNFGSGTRWGGTTVEELAEWTIKAQVAFEELGLDYEKNITIKITRQLTTPTGRPVAGLYNPLWTPGSFSLTDSSANVNHMQGVVYHEYFHHSQKHTAPYFRRFDPDDHWLEEGSATWFEDVVEDRLNNYGLVPDIMSVGLDANKKGPSVNGSAPDFRDPYERHTFFMLLARKCDGFKAHVRDLFGDKYGEVGSLSYTIINLSGVIADSDCDFGNHVGNDRASNLVAAITYYVYASLFANDMNLLDSDAYHSASDPVRHGFVQVKSVQGWPNRLVDAIEFPLIAENLSGNLPDVPVSIIPSVGAYSFELPYDYVGSPDGTVTELPDGTVAELIVNPIRGQELIVSVSCLRRQGCQTDENRQAFNDLNTIGDARDLHTWFSTRDANSHIIARERLPGLYITIVNPSLSEDVDVEILLRIRRETEITAQPGFTSHNDGDRVSNRVIAVSGIFPEEVRDQVNRVVVTANGLRSETVMRSDGAFREQIIMFAGDNIITAQGFSGETPVTQAARINLRGEQSRNLGARNQLVPSRVGFVLRWDTSNTDVDIHSTDKYSRTIYFGNRVQYPGFLDFDDLSGYGPEVISYRALEHDIYRNGTFEVDIHLYSSRGTAATNFTLDVILNETEPDSRRLHRYKSVTPLTPANTWFGDILKISCSRDGVCQVNSIDESKLASIGTTGSSGEANASSEASASGRCSFEGACEVNSVEGAKGDPTSPAKTDLPSGASTSSRSGATRN